MGRASPSVLTEAKAAARHTENREWYFVCQVVQPPVPFQVCFPFVSLWSAVKVGINGPPCSPWRCIHRKENWPASRDITSLSLSFPN